MKEMDKSGRNYNITIILLSVLIPLIVSILLFNTEKLSTTSGWIRLLPHFNALINSITALVLTIGFLLVRKGHTEQHKMAMTSAFILGTLFLISYLIYHSTTDSTVFGDINHNGALDPEEAGLLKNKRIIYLILLLSHILCAIVVVPFVLFAFYFALKNKFIQHKKIVRFTLPLWLYVSISGVIVYLMISPYY